jgi:hypothetical protein
VLQPPRQVLSQTHAPVVVSHTSVGPQPPQQVLSATHTPEAALHVLQMIGAHVPAPPLAQASQRQPLMLPQLLAFVPLLQVTLHIPPTPQVGSGRQNPHVVEFGSPSHSSPTGHDAPQVVSHRQRPQFATSAVLVLQTEPAGHPPPPPHVVSHEQVPVLLSHFS